MKFVKETRIAAPPETVFLFHESPGALQHLIPPWEKMEVVESSGSLRPGSKVVLAGRILGFIPVRWVAIRTDYEPPHLFADARNPARSPPGIIVITSSRTARGGTILRDEVEYQPPLGVLGLWLSGWLIRGKLERMFAYRHDTTRRLIESGEWQAEERPVVE